MNAITALALLSLLTAPSLPSFPSFPPPPTGPYRAILDLAGGPLRFRLELAPLTGTGTARVALCNGQRCQQHGDARLDGDTLRITIADFDATIAAAWHGDSLVGYYHNVGNRGPRTIPFRASRGTWPATKVPAALAGRWDATFYRELDTSPRVFEFRGTPRGLEGTMIAPTGDYGDFWGGVTADSFALGHFDGSFVYLITGRINGDTLTGVFHAGPRTQTPFTAVRSTGRPHLPVPTAMTQADTLAPFAFAFRDTDGRLVSSTDERFRGKVVLVDVFGTWCPTCHDAAPELVRLWNSYHGRGLEIVGLAYEVSGDTATDGALVRRYREKFGIPFPLLLAGTNVVEATAATLPQLRGFTAYPTSVFIGRDGRVKKVHAGFYGPATGDRHARLVEEFRATIDSLLRGGS